MKRAILFVVVGVLALQVVSATLTTADVTAWWDMDECSGTTITDEKNGSTGSLVGANMVWDCSVAGKPANIGVVNVNTPTDGQYIELYDLTYNASFTLGIWAQTDSNGADRMLYDHNGTSAGRFFLYTGGTSSAYRNLINSGTDIDAGSFYGYQWGLIWVEAYANGTVCIYYNNTADPVGCDTSGYATPNPANTVKLGDYVQITNAANNWDGHIGPVMLFNRALIDSERSTVFNSSAGTKYARLFPGASPTTYTVNVNDLFNDADLSGTNVSFYNTTAMVYSALSDASGNVQYSTNATTPASLSFNVTKTNYISLLGQTITANTSTTANITQGVYRNVSVYSVVTGALISPPFTLNVQGGKNYTLDGSATNIYLQAGTMNFTFIKAGWYDLAFNKTVTALTNTTTNTTGAYDARLNVTAKDALTNASINSFNLTSYNATYAYNATLETTSGVTSTTLLQGLSYVLFIDAPGYSPANATVTVSNTTPTYAFTLYTENSVYVNIFDEDTGARVYENISIIISGANYSTTNYTATSTFYVDGLSDGNYTFKFSGANYTLKSYTVTVGHRSTQTLNAYLSASTAQTIFTYQDASSGETLEGVGATMYRLINSSWTVVESKTSDITGRAQFTYTTGVKYKFYSTITGYDDKVFYLDPVLFSSYTVKMTRQVSLSDAGDNIGVSIIYSPQSFEANDTGNFSFLITSPAGALVSYGLNLTYPGTSAQYTGANANGGQFTHAYNLSNATGTDTFVVRYWYNSTLSGYRNFTAEYRIKGVYSQNSIEAMKNNRFGIGVFETVLVSIIIAGIVAGVAAMIAGPVVGGGLGLVMLGFFVYIGFVPIWAALISFLIGFLIIVKKGD